MLHLRDIGLDLAYRPGTIVAICGDILNHEVKSWAVGERVCYAHFMREALREKLNVPPAGWCTQQDFKNIVPSTLYNDVIVD